MNEQIVRMKNQVYKILPLYEEESEWYHHLMMTVVELNGLHRLVRDPQIFSVICKLHGLNEEADKKIVRSTVFRCLRILDDVQSSLR